jgi:enterochelin esterase-like enzyme
VDADVPLRWLERLLVALVLIPVAWIGVRGVYGYWESYYVHRGFAPVRPIPHSGHGQNVIVHFYSQALHREFDYRVFLPPRYDPARHRYPVYYLLHGSPGRPQVYIAIADMGVRMDNLIAEHHARPMILVFPDGRIGGSTFSDSEWANTPSGNYMSDVIDVVHDVDRRFATLRNRRYRVIAGFSEGAYGALNVALHNLPVFGDVQVWSGYFTQSRTGVFAKATPAALADNSPLDYVDTLGPELQRYPLKAYMFVGNGDRGSRNIAQMAAEMKAVGVNVAWHIFRGGHDWQLWNHHVDGMIVRASNAMTPPGAKVFVPPKPRVASPVPGQPSPLLSAHAARGHHRKHARGGRLGRRARSLHRRAHRRGRRLVSGGVRTPAPVVVAPQAQPPGSVLGLPGTVLPGTVGSGIIHSRGPPHHRRRHRPAPVPASEVITGLLLALVSAALINLGFLLQHEGLDQVGGDSTAASFRRAFRNRTWLAGQALGWIGFVTQIVAVVVAPLSLVQAFAAGGLALSVPLSATIFGHRIARSQQLAVLMIAAGLAVLPIATPVVHEHLIVDRMMLAAIVGVAVATVIATSGPGARQAVAAGIFYGVADASIKAIAVRWSGHHHLHSLLSGWTGLALIATFLGFITFQTALRTAGPVGSISLMNAFAALVALAAGLLAFGESLGRNPLPVAGHLIAIALVLVCVPSLAAAQEQIAAGDRRRREERQAREELRRRRAAARARSTRR